MAPRIAGLLVLVIGDGKIHRLIAQHNPKDLTSTQGEASTLKQGPKLYLCSRK